MNQATPKTLAVIDAFVGRVANISSMRGAEYDAPMDYTKPFDQYPFTFVYDADGEEYRPASANDHTNNELFLRTVTVFEWSDDDGDVDRRPRRRGNYLAADLIEGLVLPFPQTLGGLCRVIRPQARICEEVVAETGRQLAALTMVWSVTFGMQLSNIRVAA